MLTSCPRTLSHTEKMFALSGRKEDLDHLSALIHEHKITELDFSNCLTIVLDDLRLAHLKIIADLIMATPSIKKLNLADNSLTNFEACYILANLKESGLTSLDLSHNLLTDELGTTNDTIGKERFGGALLHTQINELILSHNDFKDPSVLIEDFRGSKLKALDLSHNKTRLEGVQLKFLSRVRFTPIEQLNLSHSITLGGRGLLMVLTCLKESFVWDLMYKGNLLRSLEGSIDALEISAILEQTRIAYLGVETEVRMNMAFKPIQAVLEKNVKKLQQESKRLATEIIFEIYAPKWDSQKEAPAGEMSAMQIVGETTITPFETPALHEPPPPPSKSRCDLL